MTLQNSAFRPAKRILYVYFCFCFVGPKWLPSSDKPMRSRQRWIVYWPCHIHHHDSPILDTRGKAKEGAPEDHVAVDDREGNGPHSSHIKGLVAVDVEGLRFLPQT